MIAVKSPLFETGVVVGTPGIYRHLMPWIRAFGRSWHGMYPAIGVNSVMTIRN